jgi:hypothetical protein
MRPAHRKLNKNSWKNYERTSKVKLSKVKIKKSPQPRFKSEWKLGVIALAFLVILIIVGKIMGVLGSLSSEPLNGGFAKSGTWDGETPLNLVVKADETYLFSYSPSEKSLLLFKIPKDTYVDMPYDYGKWPVQSIYGLGQSEKPPIGAKLLQDTISYVFGIPVDGYIITSEKPLKDLVDSEQGALSGGFNIFESRQSNLNILEKLRLWWSLKFIRSDKIQSLDLGKSDLSDWYLLPDSSRVLTLNQTKLDQFLRETLEDKNIKSEGLTIGIYNATDYLGLADRAARLITNMGGRVIFTQNAPNLTGKSTIVGKNSYTFNRLKGFFKLVCNKDEVCGGDKDPENMRADIIITLGTDAGVSFKKP